MTDIETTMLFPKLFLFFTSIGLFVVCSFAGGAIMKSKGRSEFFGNVLGLIFGPIGVIICFCWPKDEEEATKRLIESGRKKRCGECGSLIDANATVCPFCSYAKAILEQLKEVVKNKKM